jgi:F0F1-type ATP synthase epsilon subunit
MPVDFGSTVFSIAGCKTMNDEHEESSETRMNIKLGAHMTELKDELSRYPVRSRAKRLIYLANLGLMVVRGTGVPVTAEQTVNEERTATSASSNKVKEESQKYVQGEDNLRGTQGPSPSPKNIQAEKPEAVPQIAKPRRPLTWQTSM